MMMVLQLVILVISLWFALGVHDIQVTLYTPSVVNMVVQMGCTLVGEVTMEECQIVMKVMWMSSRALWHEKLMRPDKHIW